MKNRRKFFAGACWNDGRRNLNEGAIVYLKTAAEDLSGSCNTASYCGHLDMCGDGLYLRLGAGVYQYGGCSAGGGSSDYLLHAKRHYPVGDGISYQSLWAADGCDLAAGQGAGFSVFSARPDIDKFMLHLGHHLSAWHISAEYLLLLAVTHCMLTYCIQTWYYN